MFARSIFPFLMAGVVPDIRVDGRVEPGHDDEKIGDRP